MSAMSEPFTDEDAIVWARAMAKTFDAMDMMPDGDIARRLADLADKGAEGWRPIATAPDDAAPMTPEVEILVSDPHEGITIAVRRLGWWYEVATDDRLFPTHWRPLPASPGGER